ncbi:MAG: NAD(P)/FAD-dependent oxidoreductase [Cyanobacteria bacterium P01_H01_bin.15]
MKPNSVVVIGAGPAGLTAAYQLSQHAYHPIVLEQADKVGGIARTENYQGYRFDIGGHRFYTKVEEVQQLWRLWLQDDFLKVTRLSRIYYRGKFFDYPLSIRNTLSGLGILNSSLIVLSYLQAKLKALWRRPDPQTFESWVTHCFGQRLYETFFKTYTEKVWGISCSQIQADWAKQRIRGVSLKQAVINALIRKNNTKSLITEFDYPRLGPGMMWEQAQQSVEDRGGQVHCNTPVLALERKGDRISSITIERNGQTQQLPVEQVISSMPITSLLKQLSPAPPTAVLEAAAGLSYRAFMIVTLIINKPSLFPDQWIYIHDSGYQVGRIQNFKNWSAQLVPDLNKTSLGMEYFCSEGDNLWQLSQTDLFNLAIQEVERLGFAPADQVQAGTIIRQPKAYPVYDAGYQDRLQVIREYLSTIKNLQTIGRNGMHRYNNQDHSMLTGLLAAKNILGEHHDLWQVNTERSYYEELTVQKQQTSPFEAVV